MNLEMSEHALKRYCERKLNMGFEHIESSCIAQCLEKIDEMGGMGRRKEAHIVVDGVKFVVEKYEDGRDGYFIRTVLK